MPNQLRELARMVREERTAMGLSVDEYYDRVVAPYFELRKLAAIASEPQATDRFRCKAISKINGKPHRQCLNGAGPDGFCHRHRPKE
jgi:hypothetical protein